LSGQDYQIVVTALDETGAEWSFPLMLSSPAIYGCPPAVWANLSLAEKRGGSKVELDLTPSHRDFENINRCALVGRWVEFTYSVQNRYEGRRPNQAFWTDFVQFRIFTLSESGLRTYF
jgi:hypothetical protein